MPVFLIALLVVFILFLTVVVNKRKWNKPKRISSEATRDILIANVPFYNKLKPEKKKRFEYEIEEFLVNYKITAISTSISETERILIAASGVIPIFSYPEWRYQNLKEILVYPDTFTIDFKTEGDDRTILGMVGTGIYSNKMFLSKRAIVNGFASEKDGHNTAIHEFVHLIDGMDGEIDGLPEVLLKQPYLLPWLDLIQKEMHNIKIGESELRPYGSKNRSEFFAVAGEFFFERPELLQSEHPALYDLLNSIFNKA
jgi:Mlc titration factor MtfA (ptsG expression regulator)